ncbi:hypothetical protein K440DRAFT_134769 [Wilcoxina mikolae CBS 423.85]|nr:hypothetical protein K440DRAFT_134769 [Wilcoxina mikolae CBS 423.85]
MPTGTPTRHAGLPLTDEGPTMDKQDGMWHYQYLYHYLIPCTPVTCTDKHQYRQFLKRKRTTFPTFHPPPNSPTINAAADTTVFFRLLGSSPRFYSIRSNSLPKRMSPAY